MRNIKMTMSRMQLNSKFVNNMLPEWGRFVTAVKLNRGLRDSNYDQLYAYLKGASIDEGGGWRWLWGSLRNRVGIVNPVDQQGRLRATTATLRRMRVALDDEQLLFLKVGHGQRQLMKIWLWRQPVQDLASMWINDPVYDEAGPSYDLDILSEVHDHDHYQDAVCEHHEEHEMHDDVQPNYVVDSHADYTSNSNMIPYDQYVKDNAVPVVQSNVSSVTNDAYMMIYNDMCEPHAQSVSKTTRNIVVDNSLTAELETYKEQVELYERRARFELTEREQKIDEQLRIVITDRNIKEENLKKELHSVKLQLASTINHNKSMVEELWLQDLYGLTRAKQVQPALYNGYEIVKNNHVLAIVHNTEDTLEIAEITRRKMHDKMKDPECVTHKEDVEIERKNFLIANDNLIADCLFKDVFHVATNSELNISSFTEMHDAHTSLKAHCLKLKVELSNLRDKIQKDNLFGVIKRFSNLETLDFQITQLTEKINVLQEQNELFRAENGKIKQHYKELYDSIKITRAKHLEQTTALLTENESLKVQIQNKLSCVNKDHVKPKVLAPGKYAIDVEPIPPRNRNNREVHLVYLKHLKESVETLREIVEEAKVERPLDSSLASACRYTKHSQELLEYVIGTCPKALNTRDNKHASTSLPKKKQVTFEEQCAMSKSNTHKPVEQLNCQKTNVPVPPSTGVNSCTDASGSQPRSNTKKNKILPAKSVNMKKVEEHPRTIKSSLKTTNRVDSSISSKHTVINSNSHSVCQTCNKCLISANHDMCVVTYLHSVNASPSVKNVVRKVKQVWKPKQVKQVWKPTGNILTTVGYQWMPTRRTFTLGEQCPLTRLTKPKKVSMIAYANPREPNHNWGSNFPNSPSSSIFKCRVYYVEGLGYNLFSVKQFCDSDLEVAFRKHSCYVRDTNGVELIKGSRGSNLYIISIEDMLKSSPIYLLSKASKNKSWLWHRRLNHLNFGTINDLARKDLVRGLSRLKFEKDHLCSACQLGKSNKHTHKPKTENTNLEVLNTHHMDLCGPMRVQTINGKKYILVIVDDYSRFTWVKFLRLKDETLEVVIKFLKQIQVGLNKTVRNIRTDNGTEFVNKDLTDYYERVGIFHQKIVPRTP
ncbi:retrovirus-related pol polyprotein from transposon TNT 1-94 [Tanacetum coccineum]